MKTNQKDQKNIINIKINEIRAVQTKSLHTIRKRVY